MIRQSTAAGSSNATMLLTYSQGTSFQWRTALNGSTTQVVGTMRRGSHIGRKL